MALIISIVAFEGFKSVVTIIVEPMALLVKILITELGGRTYFPIGLV